MASQEQPARPFGSCREEQRRPDDEVMLESQQGAASSSSYGSEHQSPRLSHFKQYLPQDMKAVYESVGCTEETYRELMQVNNQWPYPADQDGWMLIHNAIRWDMDQITKALAAMLAHLSSGQQLEDWKIDYIGTYYGHFHTVVRLHHEHQQGVYFPWMATRAALPAELTKDNMDLRTAMDKCAMLAGKLHKGRAAAKQLPKLQALQAHFDALCADLRTRFAVQEALGLALLRLYFSAAEVQQSAEAQPLKALAPLDLAYCLRPLQSLEEKRRVMGQLGIPWLVQRLVVERAVTKDKKKRIALVKALQTGRRKPEKDGSSKAGKDNSQEAEQQEQQQEQEQLPRQASRAQRFMCIGSNECAVSVH